MTAHAFLTEAEIKRMAPDVLDAVLARYDAAIAQQQSELHRAQRIANKLRGEVRRRKVEWRATGPTHRARDLDPSSPPGIKPTTQLDARIPERTDA